MGKIRIHKGRPVWIPTVAEQFDGMITEHFIKFIKEPGSLTHNDFLFRTWMIEHIPERKRTISKEVKEQCLQFLRDKRAEQNEIRHEAERQEALAYKNM
jgi:hypothetical protein